LNQSRLRFAKIPKDQPKFVVFGDDIRDERVVLNILRCAAMFTIYGDIYAGLSDLEP